MSASWKSKKVTRSWKVKVCIYSNKEDMLKVLQCKICSMYIKICLIINPYFFGTLWDFLPTTIVCTVSPFFYTNYSLLVLNFFLDLALLIVFLGGLMFFHGGSKEKKKQLWKTVMFRQLVFSTRESWRTNVTDLVLKCCISRFIQTNLLSG